MFPFYPRKTAEKEEKNRKGDQTKAKSSSFYKLFIWKDLGCTKKMAPAAGTSEDFFSPQIVSDQEDLNSKVANLAAFTQEKKAGSNGNFWCLHL